MLNKWALLILLLLIEYKKRKCYFGGNILFLIALFALGFRESSLLFSS